MELLLITVFSLLMPLSLSRPETQDPTAYHDNQQNSSVTPIPIISFTEVVGEGGNFNYSYETGNGIHSEQSGYTKVVPRIGGGGPDALADSVDDTIQVLTGSFSYQAPDGTIISLRYIADENGFQPVGDHLPTPPPIPEGIQRVLDTLPKNEIADTNSFGQQSHQNITTYQARPNQQNANNYQNNPSQQNNPGQQYNPGQQNNPGQQYNPSQQNNPGQQYNPGQQNNPGQQYNQGQASNFGQQNIPSQAIHQ